MGAEVTAVDCAAKEQMLREIGADQFIDYAKDDFTESDQSFDVIFSIVVNRSYSRCVDLLKPNGRYLLANPRLIDMLRAVVTSKFTDKTTTFAFAGEKEEELQTLSEMIDQGKIRVIVDRIYSFEQAAEAHRRVETEQRLGSVIITNQR
jgi:NADPH:quinone reductase-like Zn-dependent oxidoreductase